MMHQQHVIDWWVHRGYRVTVLTDWSLLCLSEAAIAAADPEQERYAIGRLVLSPRLSAAFD